MALGIDKVLEIAFSAAGSLIPEDLKAKARYALKDYNPWEKVKTNHDLIRSVRLAWIEAALRVISAAKAAAPTLAPDRAHDLRAIANQLKEKLKQARNAALTRDTAIGAHPIDAAAKEVLGGTPEHIGGTDSVAGEQAINEGFGAIAAAVIGCPIEDIPQEMVSIARRGIVSRVGDVPDSFASLVFKEFAEIIKDGKYPAATEAFRIHLWNQVTQRIAALDDGMATSIAAIGGMEDRLAEWCGEIDARLNAILAGTGRIETKVSEIEAQLRELVERMHPQPGEAAALGDEIEHLRSAADIRDGAIVTFLRDVGAVDVKPDRWSEELQKFARRYRELLAEAERPRNLPAEFERDLKRAAERIRAGDLDGADALLQVLDAKLDRWAVEQHEMLRQSQRDRASVKVERAGIAMTRLRYREAATAYGEAAELMSFDAEAARGHRVAQGNALLDFGRDFGVRDDLEKAIASFRIAIDLASRAQLPTEMAAAQNSLGKALSILGAREQGTTRLDEAVIAYQAALQVRTRESLPIEWAISQNNLGNALSILGEREVGTARLDEAVSAYRAALQVRTRESLPLDWAGTQNNLGNTLQALGWREEGTVRLGEAVSAYRSALQVWTREALPRDWAMTQNNLGNALQMLGDRDEGTSLLKEAVAAYQAALQVRTRENLPLDWAATQSNLGNALQLLGNREEETTRLEEAVSSYLAALQVRTRETLPLDWAMTQSNLGNALQALGARETGTARLVEAAAAHKAALAVYEQAQAHHYVVNVRRDLRRCEEILRIRDAALP